MREENGESISIEIMRNGKFFGEMAVLKNMARTATVRALQPTTLLAMDRDAFRSLVAQSLSTTQDFDQVISSRLANLAHLSGH